VFLRNHDEIDLGRLSDEERQRCFQAFAPDPEMQLYRRGIRRRLSLMLQGDRRRIELLNSAMFTLPGTPVMQSVPHHSVHAGLARARACIVCSVQRATLAAERGRRHADEPASRAKARGVGCRGQRDSVACRGQRRSVAFDIAESGAHSCSH